MEPRDEYTFSVPDHLLQPQPVTGPISVASPTMIAALQGSEYEHAMRTRHTDDRSHTPRWPAVTPAEVAQVPKAVEIARGILFDLWNAPLVIADALEEAGVDVNVQGLRELQYPNRDIHEWLMAIAESK